ncbi:hypothetical protein [Brevundimonas sp. Root1279]|uniref:hypothetical protein n=1 Tax=Brevundimonas sp. Root1279 TaxID=1736443 RepID=UPI0006FAC95D|nr:hypothetical protein [Brevundimonas sp. Root1279]KQW81876.1 hypothetical protein ASC65_11360 [Brevundimonas sp. Root1279]
MTEIDPTARLLAALEGIDLMSADGRAGLGVVLAEIGRRSPDAVLRQAAYIDLRRIGWPAPAPAPQVPPHLGEVGCRAATGGRGPLSPPPMDPHGPA